MGITPTSTVVVKRRTASPQTFDPEKLEASLRAACLAVRALEGEATAIARQVSLAVARWLHDKAEVTSDDLRQVAAQHLSQYHTQAAYMYERGRLMI